MHAFEVHMNIRKTWNFLHIEKKKKTCANALPHKTAVRRSQRSTITVVNKNNLPKKSAQ